MARYIEAISLFKFKTVKSPKKFSSLEQYLRVFRGFTPVLSPLASFYLLDTLSVFFEEVWDESLNTRRNIYWAEQNGGGNRGRLSYRSFSKYADPPFIATVKEATITKNKTKQTVSQISNFHCYYCLFMGRGGVKGGQWTGP